ncbi:hypothetical protein [Fibrella rubiginis]|nr:hypothetical protein [Fibrella rubiginis]
MLVFENGIDTVEYKEWHQPIEIILGVSINIGAYLDDQGVGK